MPWKVSRYTQALPLDEGRGLLYNGRSGAVLELSARPFQQTRQMVEARPGRDAIPRDFEDQPIFPHLAAGGFVVHAELDELQVLQDQYETERQRSQFLLTILPTFGCNLGCAYCFVGKKRGMIAADTQQQLIDFVANHLSKNQVPSMHVDWFGGEPLLALPAIQRLSREFIRICDEHATPYRSQVISNGTAVTDETVRVLLDSRVDRLQITLDGPPEIHDERRPYKSGRRSSFDAIMQGLPLLVGRFLIRLRINVDTRNLHLVWPLLDLFAEKGWLGPETKFFPYLARISPFTEACSSVSTLVCSMDEFYSVQFQWMQRLEELGVPVSAQGLYQFPEPKLYNCGAVGSNGFVFTPEGEIHKCGLAVDDSREAIGRLDTGIDPSHPNAAKWRDYSPFRNPVCRECEFLPTCLGGCPRNQMEMREVQVKENCTYHMKFERQLLLFHLGHRDHLEPPRVPVAQPVASGRALPVLQ